MYRNVLVALVKFQIKSVIVIANGMTLLIFKLFVFFLCRVMQISNIRSFTSISSYYYNLKIYIANLCSTNNNVFVNQLRYEDLTI